MTDTWNFPCYNCNDWGTFDAANRGAHGMVWAIGPEVTTLQPFTNTITGIFSIFLRSGWTDVSSSYYQHLTSIGGQNNASWGLLIGLSTANRLQIMGYDMGSTTARHQVELGDEDGSSWIQADKWYQVAFSMSPTAFSYAVNGTTTPTVNVISAVDGNLNLDNGSDRWWMHCGVTANSSKRTIVNSDQLTVTSGWPTFVVGASAWDTNYIDLSSSTARGRIFDTAGNFKNPGEDGSLWFGDTYAANTPAFYFLDGSPRKDNGAYNASVPQGWVATGGGGAGSATAPGGLRKQYENTYPDDWWIYTTLAVAEASGDAWSDGDTIFTANAGGLYLYKSSLAVSGYSGLIHKYPFGRGSGTPSTVTVRGSEGANTDPDTWTNYSLATTGTDGVDYANDTDSGLSRLRAITSSGKVIADGTYILTSNDATVFRIIDDADFPTSAPTGIQHHAVRSWIDASNYHQVKVRPYGGNPGPWHYTYNPAGVDASSGVTSDTPRRVWIYLKAGVQYIYLDEVGTPINSGKTIPESDTGSSLPIVQTRTGDLVNSGYTMRLGTDVFGSMTVV